MSYTLSQQLSDRNHETEVFWDTERSNKRVDAGRKMYVIVLEHEGMKLKKFYNNACGLKCDVGTSQGVIYPAAEYVTFSQHA